MLIANIIVSIKHFAPSLQFNNLRLNRFTFRTLLISKIEVFIVKKWQTENNKRLKTNRKNLHLRYLTRF